MLREEAIQLSERFDFLSQESADLERQLADQVDIGAKYQKEASAAVLEARTAWKEAREELESVREVSLSFPIQNFFLKSLKKGKGEVYYEQYKRNLPSLAG